jgi:Tol biopolymer transport system component
VDKLRLRLLKHFPRWWRWVVITLAILALALGSVVVIVSKTNNAYVCLSATDEQYTTGTFDTNTGKMVRASLFPLKPYEQLLASFPSPDKTRIVFSWLSNNYVRLLTMLDLQTMQKHTVTFSLTDNELVVNGWSADGKYLTVYERKDNAQSTFTIFEAATMRIVVTKTVDNAIWSPQGHDLAILETQNGRMSEITITSPDRADDQTFSLTDKIAPDEQPVNAAGLSWSPDGRYLTLVNESHLWVYNVATMTLQKVTDRLGRAILQWSTDGKTLLYTESVDDGNANLVAYNPGTATSVTLTTTLFGVFRFRPNFKYALVTHLQPDQQVSYYLLNIDTGRETLLKANTSKFLPTEILWLAQSETLVFMYDGGAFWGNSDGSALHDVSGLNPMTPLFWNDQWIAYSRLQLDGDHPGLINLQTGDHLTFREAYADLYNLFPSPDGKTLALLFDQQPGQHFVKMILFSADDQHSTTYETKSGDMGRLVWSPDSSQIALYTYIVAGPTTLHILRTDGTEIRHFDNLPRNFYLDKWTTCDDSRLF